MRDLKKYLGVRFSRLFMICPLFFWLQTGGHPLDNLSILNNMASTVAQKTVDQLSPDSSASFLIRSQSQQQTGKWLVENWLIKSLYERDIKRIYLEKQESATSYIIEFQIYGLGVNYLATDKNNFIERRFKLNLVIRAIESSSGQVKFYQEFKKQYADSVNILNIRELEQSDYPFTHDDLPKNRGLKRFIEPFIVTTATASIIYLFFRLRSN